MKIASATQNARQFVKIQCVRAALSGLAIAAVGSAVSLSPAYAQSFPISSIEIEGNQRIDDATILSFLRLERGQSASAGQLNDAVQRLQRSGLFETVDVVPVGNRLVVTVNEFPTINRVNIEGNKRLKDADLVPLLQSQSRRVYSPATAEADAALIAEGYTQAGRIAATVTPRIIARSNNRVDVIFEVAEGDVVEVERISFIGNRAYSDRRLRRVIESKQAGLLRSVIQSDTFVADRIAFDRQLLRDFYLSRGYVDFQVLSSTPELTRERDGYFVSFNVREGQQFKVGRVSTYSDLPEIDADEYHEVARLKDGEVYSPSKIENTITRMERLALQNGLNFIRVEPRITRNDADVTLDVEFAIIRGPRVFVERIDIEGNATTLDRVIRRQFDTVEGDPFNPRAIRDAAERIRALGYFSTADVNTRQGSGPEQVVVDVDVEETTTGSLGFGVSFNGDSGASLNVSFRERNFLGRGQTLAFSFDTGSDNQSTSVSFTEPAFLGRDLSLSLSTYYTTTDSQFSDFDTQNIGFEPSIEFPVSENGRLRLNYQLSRDSIKNVSNSVSEIIQRDDGSAYTSAFGYQYSYDTRRTGLNPNGGVLLQFGQEIGGIGGGIQYLQTTGSIGAETKVAREEVTLRARFDFGANTRLTGNSRITERFFLGSSQLRGFEGAGVGPRDLASTDQDALGGNYFAVARFEADFPLGLPEEYGIRGGAFFDVGSLWGLDDTIGTNGVVVDDSFKLRSVIGVSLLWDTSLGPLRFNFSKALVKEDFDEEQSFDLTVSTQF
ncbi:MAG: outer membrane protein assembly factor BamA [Litoreibacter sp.]|uniref:outer membrane protein assembly factor BamA n=1 Tax=Litoreibacter sp. TaxID=1969459 RepID=UPI0032981494